MSVVRIDLTSDADVQLICKRGDTFLFEDLVYWNDEEKTDLTDLTGYTWTMKVVDADGNTVLSFSGSDFVVHDTNKVRITKAAADMLVDASPVGQPYTFDLQETTGAGVVSTIMSGTFEIEQDIS